MALHGRPRFLPGVVFLVAVAAVVASAKLSAVQTVLAILGALLVVVAVELVTSRRRPREPAAARPRLEAVPPLQVVPAPEVLRPVRMLQRTPREWNIRDLERLSMQQAGLDAVRDEERSYLLAYLREFAGSDGRLPIDFDSIVRDSFGDLTGAG
jgi:hypothetical protein